MTTGAGTPGRIRSRSDQGATSVIVVLLATALFALGGLVFDGGRAITGRQRAANEAEQAARAGADAVSLDTLRGDGALVLDSVRARAAAESYLAATGDTGRVEVTPTSVTVRVDVVVDTAILGIVGVNTLTVSNTASARAVRGIDTEEP
jgi:Flp pilus assembly protein TadG